MITYYKELCFLIEILSCVVFYIEKFLLFYYTFNFHVYLGRRVEYGRIALRNRVVFALSLSHMGKFNI